MNLMAGLLLGGQAAESASGRHKSGVRAGLLPSELRRDGAAVCGQKPAFNEVGHQPRAVLVH